MIDFSAWMRLKELSALIKVLTLLHKLYLAVQLGRVVEQLLATVGEQALDTWLSVSVTSSL